MVGLRCIVFSFSYVAAFLCACDRWLNCASSALSAQSLVFFFLISLSKEGKLGPADDDERYVQKAISTTSSGAKPLFRSYPWTRALGIDFLTSSGTCSRLCGGGNRLEKHSAIAEMCTLELLTASGRTAAGEETAGMLLFIASIIVQIVLASLSSHVSFSPFQTGLCF